MEYTKEELIDLEFEIKENVEWLVTQEDDEVECISMENIESILNHFLKLKKLKLELVTNK